MSFRRFFMLAFSLILFLTFISVTNTAASNESTVQGEIILLPAADTFIGSSNILTWIGHKRISERYANFGDNQGLSVIRGRQVGTGEFIDWRSTLIRFDLSAIPASANIKEAKLFLYHYSVWTDFINIHRMKKDWGEMTATWYQPFDDSVSWWDGWQGDINFEKKASDTRWVGDINTWVSFDITKDVKSFLAGTTNYGWYLESAYATGTSTTSVSFYSRHALQEEVRPYLKLVLGDNLTVILVPNVIGMTLNNALTAIATSGLNSGTVIYQISAVEPEGNVIGQNPSAGISVAAASSIHLIVAKKPDIGKTVPDVRGLSLEAGRAAINAINLKIGSVTYQYSAAVPDGFIISQSPEAGTTVFEETLISLEVCQWPKMVSVPDMVGRSSGEADGMIRSLGLVSAIDEQYNDTVSRDFVISQHPMPGTSMAEGSTVNLLISLGPQHSLKVNITSHIDGEAVTGNHVMIQGELLNAKQKEVGVIVNGILAILNGGQFVANHVPLNEGQNLIKVIATDAMGNHAETSITVNATPNINYITVIPDQKAGTAPHDLTLILDASFDVLGDSILVNHTCDGPGAVEYLEITKLSYKIRIPQVGIYYFTFDVTDETGTSYRDKLAVEVLDVAKIDEMLKTKWEIQKEAFKNGNVDTALLHYPESKREIFRQAFTLKKEEIAANMSLRDELNLVYIGDGIAEYENVVYEPDGIYSYPVLFIKDEDGTWKIQ